MSPSKPFHLAPKFEIALDGRVVEDGEAIDDRGGLADFLDDVVGIELEVLLVAHGQDDRVDVLERDRNVLRNAKVLEFFLVAEEPRPGISHAGIRVLRFEFPPMLHVGVVDTKLSAHFGELAHDELGAAVARVANVFAVRSAEHEDLGRRYGAVQVTQGVAGHLAHAKGAGVVDIDGRGRDFKDIVFPAEDMFVRPHAEAAVFGQAVTADAGAWENHVAVRGTDLDGLDDLAEVHAVLLGKEAPFVEKCEDGGAVAVLHDLCGLGFDGAVEHGEGELLRVKDFGEEFRDPFLGFLVDAAAHAPEVADALDIFAAGHYPFVTVRQKRLGGDAAFFKNLFHDGVGHLFGGAGRYRGFDEHERGSRDTFGNGMQRLFQRFHVGAASLEVAERFLEVVALHVDDNDVGELEGVFGERGDERLFIEDAALDHGVDFGVFGLDGGYSPV